MAESLEIYRCAKCGIIVEIFHGGMGKLACCGEPMQRLKENTTDAALEKHVPVVEKLDHGLKVTVGSVAHPMTEEHYIEWIEVVCGDKVCRQALHPGGEPSAVFDCGCAGEVTMVREYCNLHGLWKA